MIKNQVDHDRLFKELLETFFAEFMKLFFPEASWAIDFSHIKFMIPLRKGVFFSCIFPSRKIDWGYHLFN